MNILAGATQRLTYKEGEFLPDANGDWEVKCLNYWEVQAFSDLSGADHIRRTFEQALVTVPDATPAQFAEAPKVAYALPLYRAIWDIIRGN